MNWSCRTFLVASSVLSACWGRWGRKGYTCGACIRFRHWGGPSFAVYVTYSSSKEAIAAIQGVDGAVYEGRTLKASFGTTKYAFTAAETTTAA